jgi:hypothetical protein
MNVHAVQWRRLFAATAALGGEFARHFEGAREASERGAFLVSAKDLLAPFRWIGVEFGVLAALAMTIMAEVLLLGVESIAILEYVLTVAVVAGDNLSNHSWVLSFGLNPLPR